MTLHNSHQPTISSAIAPPTSAKGSQCHPRSDANHRRITNSQTNPELTELTELSRRTSSLSAHACCGQQTSQNNMRRITRIPGSDDHGLVDISTTPLNAAISGSIFADPEACVVMMALPFIWTAGLLSTHAIKFDECEARLALRRLPLPYVKQTLRQHAAMSILTQSRHRPD